MADKSTIRTGIGIGGLKFGASIRDAETYFGPPDEREESQLGEDTSIRLTWGNDLTCWFGSDDDFRLRTIQVEHADALLAGHKLITRHRDEVVALLNPIFGEPTFEDMSVTEHPDHWLADYDACSLNLWFDNSLLESIQWGYLFDESGENAIWPT